MKISVHIKKFFDFFASENGKTNSILNSKIFALIAFMVMSAQVSWGQGSETFNNLPTTSSSSYLSRSWTGDNGGTWTASAARTDQTITSKAIAWTAVNANVVSPTYTGGMGTLTFNYVRAFTGTSARSIEVYVNSVKIGSTITVSATSDVVSNYSSAINVSGNIVLEIRCTGGNQVKVDDIAWTAYSSGSTTPSLTAASSPTVDAPFDITFTDNTASQTWVSTGGTVVKVGGTILTAGYAISNGKITFTPSNSNPAGLLQTAGASKPIIVTKTGYADATVSQTIGAGVAAKLAMTTQPTSPTYNRGVLVQQPIVAIQDQYSNATTSTASVTAAATTTAWIIGGSTPKNGVLGTATFTNLTAKSSIAVTGATITFSSPGLTSVTSSGFDIPVITIPATSALTISTCSSTIFDPGGTSNYANNTTSGALLLQPSTAGAMVKITFNSFATEASYDKLYVYNGNSTSAAQVAGSPFSGTSIPAAITSSAADGTLTLQFTSDSTTTAAGFDFTVSCFLNPTITGAATATPFTTTYGTASTEQTFAVSGTNLTANLVATAPTGFEVSADGTTYGSTATFTQTSGSASGSLRIRLAATAGVTGTYNSQNIVLSSTGATAINIVTAASGNSVSKKALTITAADQSVTYGTAVSSVKGAGTYSASGFVNSETSSVISGSATYSTIYTPTMAVGTASVSITPVVTSLVATNYSFTPVAGTITIAKANSSITVTGATSFAYNGSAQGPATATVTGSTGAVTYSYSGTGSSTYSDSATAPTAVGTYQVIATVAADANYNSATSTALAFSISTKPLTISGLSADNKNFDGTTTATLSGTASLDGVVGVEDVTLTGTPVAAFTSSAVGVNVPVTVSGYSLTGAAIGNYTLTQPTLSANIIANTPTLFSSGTLTAVNATYGSASATPSSFSVSGQSLTSGITVTAPTGFEVSLTSTSDYASSITVGTTSEVNSTPVYVRLAATNAAGSYSGNITLTSTDASSITIATENSTVAQKALTITGLSGVDKTYDGTSSATVNGTPSLDGVVGSDEVTLNSAAATFAFANANAGTNKTITVAGYALEGSASSNYTLVPPSGITATINKADQTISAITESQSNVFGDAAYSVATTASSELTVTYSSSNTAVATVAANGTVTIVGAGTAILTAAQTGDANYNAATSVTQALTVSKQDQTITAPLASVSKTFGDATYSVATTASSGLTVTYASDNSSVATVAANGTVTIVGVGTAIITAAQAGNTNYNAAASVTQEVTVGKANQAITLAATDAKTTTTTTYSLTQNASSGLAITYSSSNAAVATITGNTVTIVGAGTTTITASQSGNANYNEATQVTQTLTVTAVAAPILTWNTFGNAGTETTEPSTFNNTNISAATLNYTGSIVSPQANSNRFGGQNWNVGSTLSTTKYIQFTVTPNSGYRFSPTSFDFIWDFSTTGPKSVTLRSSADNYTADLGTLTTMTASTSAVKSISISGLVNISSATTFRLYGYDATGTGGTGGFDCAVSVNNVVLNGFVSQIPAPSITSTLTASATVGTGFNYATTASNSPSSYSATGLPTGLSINTTSGVISGTPTVAGSFNVAISATNVTGTDTKTLAITIAKANQTITAIATTATKNYGDATYSVATTATSGLTVLYDSSDSTVATVSSNGTVTIVGIGTATITASQEGNDNYNAASSVTQVVTVAKANQTITFATLNAKTYGAAAFDLTATGGNSGFPITFTSSNADVASISGNTVTIVGAGTTTITASQEGDDNYNAATSITQNLVVNTKTLTITGVTANNKVYDGTTLATLDTTNAAYSGLVNGESFNVTDTPTASFATANVGAGKTVTITGYTAPSENYTLTQPAASASITAVELTITGVTANDKTYNGNTTATLSGTPVYNGLVNGESFTVSGTPLATFASANVDSGIAVTISGFEAPSNDYSVAQPSNLTANITAATLTISGLAVVTKNADGTTSATLSGTPSLNGVVTGDTVILEGTYSANFSQSTAGTNLAVTVTGYSISGASSGNYLLSQPSGLTGDIISVSAPSITSSTSLSATYGTSFTYQITASTSVDSYSSTTLPAGLTLNTETGIISGTPTEIGSFNVTVSASNFGGVGEATLTIAIVPKTLTLTPATADATKVYDGTTAANVSGASISGTYGSDEVAVSASGAYNTKNVGTSKTVNITYTLGDADAAKYKLVSYNSTTTAAITAYTLTVTGAMASSKSYDGTTAATISDSTLEGVLGSDEVSVSGGGSFESANVGNLISVTPSLTLSGSDAGNYILTQPTGLTANITAVDITITNVTANDKTYDGTTVATLSGTSSYNGLVNGETFAISGTPVASFDSAAVGTDLAVTITGYIAPSPNYTITQPSLTASITAASLTIKAKDQTVCSGTAASVVIDAGDYVLTGFVNNETASVISGSVTYTTTYESTTISGDAVAITPVISELTAPNYQFIAVPGAVTITNSTSHTTTITVCDTYTWTAGDGNTYTESGSYTFVTGCHTETLDLTINKTIPPTAVAQSFCNSGTVANLQATGDSLKWYTASDLNPLSAETALVSGNYYVSSTSNSCESEKIEVAIEVITAPTALPQTFCSSDNPTVESIVASGTGLKWYLLASGGDVLDPTTPLISGNYYVAQSVNDCETTRTMVAITVNIAPLAVPQSFCISNNPKVANLVATGTGLKWYENATGGSALASTDDLSSRNYYVSQTIDNCETLRTEVAITVDAATSIGELTALSATICSRSSATISLGASTGSISWFYSLNYENSNSDPVVWRSFPPSETVTSTSLNTGNLIYSYTYPNSRWIKAVADNGTCSSTSNVVTVVISPSVRIQKITASSSTICSGSNATLTLAVNSAGSIQWQKSTTSDSEGFENIGSIIAPTSINNGVVTLSTENLIQDTWYRIKFTNGACEAYSTSVKVAVSPASSVGELTSLVSSVCSGSNTTLTLGESTGTVTWFKSTNYNSSTEEATWTAVPTSSTVTRTSLNTGSLTYSSTKPTVWFKAVASGSTCSSTSNVVSVTISPKVVLKTITPATTLVCSGTNSTLLTLGTGYVGTPQWQYSTTSATANDFVSIDGATSDSYTATNLTSTTWFRVLLSSGVCSSATTVAIPVSVSPAAVATTITGAGAICLGSTKKLTLTAGYVGSIQWQISTDNTNFNAIASATAADYTVTGILIPGTYYYRAVLTSGACATKATSDSVTITVNAKSVAGTIAGAATVCTGTNSTPLTLSGSTGTIQWQSASPLASSSYTNLSGANSATYNANNLTSTTFYKAVVTSGVCAPVTTTVAVGIIVNPAAVVTTINGAGAICFGSTKVLTLTSGYTGTIQWQTAIDNDNFTPIPLATAATYTVPATTSVGPHYYRAVLTSGVCSTKATSDSVIVNVDAKSVVGTISSAATVCSGTNSTTLTLSGSTGNIQWQSASPLATSTYSNLSGATSSSYIASNLTATTFYKAVVSSGVCAAVTTAKAVGITVSPVAVATAITGAGPVCLGTTKALTLTSGYVGSIKWQISTDNSVFTDITPAATTASYTVPATISANTTLYYRVLLTSGACSTTTTPVTVTVGSATNAGAISGTAAVCSGLTSTLAVTGYDSGATIQWQKATTLSGLYSTIAQATSATYVTSALTATSYFKAVVTKNGCVSTTTGYAVTVSPAAKATAVSGNTGATTSATAVCSGTKTLVLASGSIGAIQWQYYKAGTIATAVTNLSSVSWTDITGATATSLIAESNTTGNVWFRAKLTSSPCATLAFSSPVNVWFKTCSATADNNNSLPTSKVAIPFAVKAYPNPSDSTFQLNFTTTSESQIEMRVYDMIGKLIETRQFSTTEMNNQEVGNSYPSGVYNVIVTQGEEMKTLRVIKK